MEKKKYTFKVNYFEKLRRLNDLANVLSDFRDKLGDFHSPKDSEKEVLNNLTQLLSQRREEITKLENEVIDFFSAKLHRYWKMRIISFDDTGKIKYEDEYEIYPYELIQENYYLACLRLDHNYYSTTFSDSGFIIDELIRKDCTIELQEIDFTDFICDFGSYANKIATQRMEKLSTK